MNFEKARGIKAAYDHIIRFQRIKRIQEIILDGARAREQGKDKSANPCNGKGRKFRSERTWWGRGWEMMNHALETHGK